MPPGWIPVPCSETPPLRHAASENVASGVDRVYRGRTRANTASGRMSPKKAFAPCRLYSCSRWRRPPSNRQSPTNPLSTIIATEYIVSRARVALWLPVSITAEIIITSPGLSSAPNKVNQGIHSTTAARCGFVQPAHFWRRHRLRRPGGEALGDRIGTLPFAFRAVPSTCCLPSTLTSRSDLHTLRPLTTATPAGVIQR